MSEVRVADVADVDEIIRLRTLMLASMGGVEIPLGSWVESVADTLRDRLPDTDQTFVTFVIEQSDHPGRLASCVSGLIEQRLGGPEDPSGLVGYVFNVCTDSAYRRRGYARACMEAVLAWYADRGVVKIDLKTWVEGAPLYRSLGFVPTASPLLRYTAPKR